MGWTIYIGVKEVSLIRQRHTFRQQRLLPPGLELLLVHLEAE